MKYIVNVASVVALFAAQQTAVPQVKDELELRLQSAIQTETVDGDLKSAIEQYKKIVARAGRNRGVAAKALVHMAGCYQKMGDAQSRPIYERVVREYGDQPEQAEAARERLAAITGGAVAKGGAMSARRTPIPASALSPHSDGRHVFYFDPAAGGLTAVGMDGANPKVIVPRRTGGIFALSISPDGKQVAFQKMWMDEPAAVCIVNADGSGLRELHPESGGVQPLGGWSPDGRHFIAHLLEPDRSYSLSVVSAQDGSVRKIPTGQTIRGSFALETGGVSGFSPDGKYIYFALRPGAGTRSTIHIVAVDGSYQGKLIDHPSSNLPMGFAPDGKHFLFQSDRSGQAGIYAIQVQDGKAQGEPVLIKQEAAVSPSAGLLTRDGAFFYTVGGRDVHAAFTLDLDPLTGKTIGRPQPFSGPSGFTPESAAWSPDGKRIALMSGRNRFRGGGDVMLTVRTLASGQDVEWKLPSETARVEGWTADGSGIYTAVDLDANPRDSKVELHSISAATGESKTLAVFPGRPLIYSVRPAPEGNALLISCGAAPNHSTRSGRVNRLDLVTGQQTEIIAEGAVSEIAFSPDGRQVAALDRQANSAAIMLKPLEAGEWKTLATLEGAPYMYLRWLPNGDLIFGKEGMPDSAIYRLSSAGGAPQKIANLASLEHVHEIRVRPDGRQLLFQSYVNNIEFWALENFLPKEFLRP